MSTVPHDFPDHPTDYDQPGCAQPTATLALAALAGITGLGLTAGWLPRALWRAAHDTDARKWWADRPRR